MSAKSRIERVRLKIERAKQHIGDADRVIQAFLSKKPYAIGAKPHPVAEIEHTTLYVESVKEVPVEVRLIAGDAIHNLRSALDHLMWQLVEASGATPNKFTAFPVSETPQQYSSSIGQGEVKKIHPDALKILKAVQPCSSVQNYRLLQLHQLDISDKHKLLLTTVASMDKWLVQLAAGIPLHFNSDRLVPLVAGREITNLPTSTYQRQAHEDFQLGVEVTFGEAEVPDGEPVVYTLNKLTDLVDGIVTRFERFL